MAPFRDRLYLSTTAEDAPALACEFGLGLEIAEYCTAANMDENFQAANADVCQKMDGIDRFTFHAPFNELCPAAIDPLVRQLTFRRYRQALELAQSYGFQKIVIHSGFIPLVYYPSWFVAESVTFWKDFLSHVPDDVTLCLENVMEPGPDMLLEIVSRVDDPRLRLCLDTGHAATRVSAVAPIRWIDPYAPFLSHVHLHNNDGDWDLHQPLGEGVLDMAAILTETERLCPEVTYTIENIRCAPSLDWLGQRGYL